jgi:hypothetical protein
VYNDWVLRGNHAFTEGGKLKKPSVTMLREWILAVWWRISSKSIAGLKCYICNALDQEPSTFHKQGLH